jgi:hypothetical protein
MKNLFIVIGAIATTTFLLTNCRGSKELGGGFNLFSIQQDRDLGAQVPY